MWCAPKLDQDYLKRMEEVLHVLAGNSMDVHQ